MAYPLICSLRVLSVGRYQKTTLSKLCCSTVALGKCVDAFDVFLDTFLKNDSELRIRPTCYTQQKEDRFVKLMEKITTFPKAQHNTDGIKKECECLIYDCLNKGHFTEISKLLIYCEENDFPLSSGTLSNLANHFSKAGFKEGLLGVQSLCRRMDKVEYDKQGGYLYFLAKASWLNNNIKECTEHLKDLHTSYPHHLDKLKVFSYSIIKDTVSNRGVAELVVVTEFIKHLCTTHSDYYPLATLWSFLFQSESFADNQQATDLLNEYDSLQIYVRLMSVPMANHLLKCNRIDYVYKLLEVVLKFDMLDRYTVITQDMFDVFYMRGDIRRCTEIVRAAEVLNTPLKEEQYKNFMVLNMEGKPSSRPVNLYKLKEYKFKI